MANIGSTMDKTVITFNSLLVIGFLGIVWLMIYGNLSGNLGFERDSLSPINESIQLTTTGNTPTSASNRINPSITNVVMRNVSNDIVSSANYTLTGVVFTNSTVDYGDQWVNVSYDITFDSNTDMLAEGVITNLTVGVGTFFTFSNTLFTITAIILLITILIGLLFLVMTITKAFKGKGSSFSE